MPLRRDDIPEDPFRWLEGDAPEVMAWVGEQNTLVDAAIRAIPGKDALARDIEAGVRLEYLSLPVVTRNGRRFYALQRADANQEVIVVREEDGSLRALVDPNAMDPSGQTYVDEWEPSDDGRFLTYNLTVDGTEIGVLHVLDVASGTDLPDAIPRTRYPSVAWLPDGSGFYYSRLPEDGLYDQRLYLHALGSAWQDDALIFGDGRAKTDTYEASLSADGRWLLVQVDVDFTTTEIHLRDLHDPAGGFRPVFAGYAAQASAWIRDGRIYLWTNLDAPNMRVLVTDAGAPDPDVGRWQTFIAEDAAPLEGVAVAKDYVVATHLRDASSSLSLLDAQGRFLRSVHLPAIASAEVATHEETNDIVIGVASFTMPFRTYACDPGSAELTLEAAPASPFDPARFLVTQHWFTSTDGARVPCFIVRRRGVTPDNGPHPVLLNGYGGFSINETPGYGGGRMAFLARGGVYVLANIRGGGEFGETWHAQGMLEKKQQCFDDFLACARFLIAEGYTSAERLAIWGGSNGGLLVGAAITQAPELFAAAVCEVPVLDMLRYPLFPIGEYWISEYGDPSKEPDRSWLRAYSPYHAVRAGARYPATLFITADSDTRVHPLHARKMAALLQADGAGGPFLLRTHLQAGHGAGRSTDAIVRDLAEIYAFVLDRTGGPLVTTGGTDDTA